MRRFAVFVRVNPRGTNTDHELHFWRQRPRLLEQKVGTPFCGVTVEKRGNACLKFEPFFYRRNFNGDGRAESRPTAFDIPTCGSPKFENRHRFFPSFIDRLRKSISADEEQECHQHGFCRAHSMALRFRYAHEDNTYERQEGTFARSYPLSPQLNEDIHDRRNRTGWDQHPNSGRLSFRCHSYSLATATVGE